MFAFSTAGESVGKTFQLSSVTDACAYTGLRLTECLRDFYTYLVHGKYRTQTPDSLL